ITRQDGSGSPQRSHSGGVSGRIEFQQPAHTGPPVGWSSSLPHAAQEGARRTDRIASAAFVMAPRNLEFGIWNFECVRGIRKLRTNSKFRIPDSKLLSSPEGRHLNTFSVAPQPFESIEGAGFRRKDVDDEIEVVEEDPLGAVVAFDVRRSRAAGRERFEN